MICEHCDKELRDDEYQATTDGVTLCDACAEGLEAMQSPKEAAGAYLDRVYLAAAHTEQTLDDSEKAFVGGVEWERRRVAWEARQADAAPKPLTLTAPDAMFPALAAVVTERERQDLKWGRQDHDPITYLAILSEEVGELAEAALHARFGGAKAEGLTEEAIHTAAVALAIVETVLRGTWTLPPLRSQDAA